MSELPLDTGLLFGSMGTSAEKCAASNARNTFEKEKKFVRSMMEMVFAYRLFMTFLWWNF